ncbi:Aprataxin-like protein [Neolecta irregularis DAH-3]|uniref:Aprataxin-like protein n=1 Tax=Neolecta irregularis (strain DAH-3) TaxID=1198029 RepID=A0A1U7LLG8_NEOID|nr:Aprataxin-like protein [Neolecta irregularis DAH-3]|eukprot:OLL23478.1 Aprataxin-like protein [Neolecta irregularis DAH-3]
MSAPSNLSAKKRSAFDELMTTKPPKGPSLKILSWRDGLGEYIKNPKANSKQIISYSDEFTLVRDAYPKATIHLLLLPHKNSNLHPFEALSDIKFLESVKSEALKVKELATGDLLRKFGSTRSWNEEIRVGTHAIPSMSHLHIHIISKDMHSESLKNKKHYNSFNTPFFIPLDDFPLEKDDERRKPTEMGYLNKDFVCWRCGKNYGKRFVELKRHLEEEFNKWRNGD